MSKYDFSATNFSVDPPPYAVPPYQYRDNEMFTLIVETDADYLRALVPQPMLPNADNRLVIYVGMLNVVKPNITTYGEAGLMVPVTLGDRAGTYMPILYLDEVELLTSGREVWGFPKFRGDISFKRESQSVVATVTESDVEIISMKMDLENKGEPIPSYNREHFLLKSIPSVSGDGYDVRQINTCLVRDDNRKEIWGGQAELNLASSARNPLGDIPINKVISSVYTVGDITLDKGEVIHDYLAGKR